MLGFWVGDRPLFSISFMKRQRYYAGSRAHDGADKNKQREVPKSLKRYQGD